mmetsp:Transcript_44747/g.83502  ORF Transcript_44747/g.83502 Transcript_44747/m.83502 type:complete len:187 (+) Transcript_44747:67-627(+)
MEEDALQGQSPPPGAVLPPEHGSADVPEGAELPQSPCCADVRKETAEPATASAAESGTNVITGMVDEVGSDNPPSGLRRRRGAEHADAESQSSGLQAAAPSPVLSDPLSPQQPRKPSVEPTTSRRRQNSQDGHPSRPLLVQLFKPPQTRREIAVTIVDGLICLVLLSCALTILDLLRHPPEILTNT